MKQRMKKWHIVIFVSMMCLPLYGVQCQSAEGSVALRPAAGVFAPRGMNLDDINTSAGFQAEWDIDESFNLRLGYEYASAGVDGGSTLDFARFPFLVIFPTRKSGPFKNVYVGAGFVHTVAHYSDGHYPDVNKGGPAVLAGVKLTDNWRAEAMFNSIKKAGRDYGGYSLSVVYDGL